MYTTTNHNGVLDFHASVKAYRAPVIVSEFNDEVNGEKMYLLESGNTISAKKYNDMWKPAKSKINWKAKGANPDTTKII